MTITGVDNGLSIVAEMICTAKMPPICITTVGYVQTIFRTLASAEVYGTGYTKMQYRHCSTMLMQRH